MIILKNQQTFLTNHDIILLQSEILANFLHKSSVFGLNLDYILLTFWIHFKK